MTAGPLAGVKVVELAQLVSGPYCGTLLMGLGAEVLKVEPTAGDIARNFGPFVSGESVYFEAVNQGKRSIRLALGTPEGREELEGLLSSADVLIYNMRASAAARLGLDRASLEVRHPDLIVCEISGFGAEGEVAGRPGVDLVFQAASGLMAATGEPGGPPTRAATNVPDFFAAMSATCGVLAALYGRATQGRAPAVNVTLLGATIAMQACWFAAHSAGGQVQRLGNASPFSAPTGSFETQDRPVVISVVNDKQWLDLLGLLDLRALAEDPRFLTNDLRCRHHRELHAQVEPAFAQRTARAWVEALTEVGISASPALDYGEVLREWPQFFDVRDGVAIAHPPFGLETSGEAGAR